MCSSIPSFPSAGPTEVSIGLRSSVASLTRPMLSSVSASSRPRQPAVPFRPLPTPVLSPSPRSGARVPSFRPPDESGRNRTIADPRRLQSGHDRHTLRTVKNLLQKGHMWLPQRMKHGKLLHVIVLQLRLYYLKYRYPRPSSTVQPRREVARTAAAVIPTQPQNHQNAITITVPHPDTLDCFVLTRLALIRDSSLSRHAFTHEEATWIRKLPLVTWVQFNQVFGGITGMEWPICIRVRRRKEFLCMGGTAQPFGPAGPGEPGLILCPPTVDSFEDDYPHDHFQALVAPRGRVHNASLQYYGKYSRVLQALPLEQQHIQWGALPDACQERWLARIRQRASRAARALRARIKLRSKLKREPTLTEIREALHHDPEADILPTKALLAAFADGEETMVLHGIQCMGYDTGLAKMIKARVESFQDEPQAGSDDYL
ncbi:hypothetical protein BC834DRAFT_38588 [Gloeopeniophorella convolvens]|nr:hypothetical protein BC834DRAFT_38588 [Gloeopeniophorella convolvens]